MPYDFSDELETVRMLTVTLAIVSIAILAVTVSSTYAQEQAEVARELFNSYPAYQVPEITTRRFTQKEMLGWLKPLHEQRMFDMTPVGQSAEGRTIWLLKAGQGKTKVMMWSQMHGDEATATMAIVDMMNFLGKRPDHRVAKAIREQLTLLLIPMLNPDGAQRFERRTAQLIDVNRDALRLKTPEAQALKKAWEAHRPEFGFNLHDQDPRTTVGNTKKVSAIALLAPASDESRSDNHVRRPAKQVAATFAAAMQLFIPGHVSKYDDTFEPRAFGDNIQKWGTSTILVESGGWPGDRNKMFLRKLNCVGFLTVLYAIATNTYEQADLQLYEQLLPNTKYIYDLILRNAQLKAANNISSIIVDIGINIDEERDASTGTVNLVGKVTDIGDLSTFTSFEEVDLKGSSVEGVITKIEQRLTMDEIRALSGKK